jgi:hypothetical protein
MIAFGIGFNYWFASIELEAILQDNHTESVLMHAYLVSNVCVDRDCSYFLFRLYTARFGLKRLAISGPPLFVNLLNY